jgi:DNA-binding transcriptional ArsR family regulator
MNPFMALADPVRRGIITFLADGERAVNDIAAAFPGITTPAISQHLKALKSCGLVTFRRDGNKRYYKVDSQGLRQIQGFLAQPQATPRMPTLVTATDLELWTNRLDAQSQFPAGKLKRITGNAQRTP